MTDCPYWFKEALKHRFEELSFLAEQHNDGIETKQQTDRKLATINDLLDEEIRQLLLEWEESLNHQHWLEKKWLYVEGVKDGMRLINSIYYGLGDSQSKN